MLSIRGRMVERKTRAKSYKQIAKEEVWIYSLSHPVTNEVRYIGQTCRSIEYRLYEHIRSAEKGGKWPVTRWIARLLAQGLKPVAAELEKVPADKDWREAESRWIAKYRLENRQRLLNATTGGEGTRGHRRSDETREKLSRIAKAQGRKPPGNAGRTFDEKARANMSAAHKGKPGTPWTPEHKEKYLASRKYEPWSDELRAKIMAARKKYKTTDAHRASLSKAAKAAWERKKAEAKTSE